MKDLQGECYQKGGEIIAANDRAEQEKNARCVDLSKHENDSRDLKRERDQQANHINQMAREERRMRAKIYEAGERDRSAQKVFADTVRMSEHVKQKDVRRLLEQESVIAAQAREIAALKQEFKAQKNETRTVHQYNTNAGTERLVRSVDSQANEIRELLRQGVMKDQAIKEEADRAMGMSRARRDDILFYEAELKAKNAELQTKDTELRAARAAVAKVTDLESHVFALQTEAQQALEDLNNEKNLQIQDITKQHAAQLEAAERERDEKCRELLHQIDGLLGGYNIAHYEPPKSLDHDMTDAGYDSGYEDDLAGIE